MRIFNIFFYVLIILITKIFCQLPNYEETNGPAGAEVTSITFFEDSIIFLGTNGQGLLKSLNNGQRWETVVGNLDFKNINSIVVTDKRFLFISCELSNFTNGIYKSNNFGKTWTESLNGLQGKLKKFKDDTLFLATKYNGILRTDDNGNTWVFLGEQETSPWNAWDLVIGSDGSLWAASPGYLSPSVSNQKTEDILHGSDFQGVYLSTDKGLTWNNLNSNNLNFLVTNIGINNKGSIITSTYENAYLFYSPDYGQTWHDVPDSTRPQNINTLIYLNDSTAFAGTKEGIYISTNSGLNWIKQTGTFKEEINIIRKNNDKLFAGTNYTVFRSVDGGLNWTENSNGLPKITIYCLKKLNNNSILAGGKSAGLFNSADKGQTWTNYRQIISPFIQNDKEIYSIGYGTNNRIFIGSSEWGSLHYSDDEGQTWNVENFSTNFEQGAVWAITRDDSNYIYLGTNGAGVWMSKENGLNIDFSGIPFGWIRSLASSKDGSIYATTYFSGVWRSQNHGKSWIQINTGLPETAVNCISITDKNVIYIGTQSGIYIFKQDEEEWRKLNPELDQIEIYSILDLSDGKLFAGTHGQGIYFTADNGINFDQTFLDYDGIIYDLVIDNDNYLFIATDNGVYKSTLPINTALSKKDPIIHKFELYQNYPNPFNNSTIIPFRLEKKQHITLEIFDVNGNIVKRLIDDYISNGVYTYIWNGLNDSDIQVSSGIYYCQIKGVSHTRTRKMILLK